MSKEQHVPLKQQDYSFVCGRKLSCTAYLGGQRDRPCVWYARLPVRGHHARYTLCVFSPCQSSCHCMAKLFAGHCVDR